MNFLLCTRKLLSAAPSGKIFLALLLCAILAFLPTSTVSAVLKIFNLKLSGDLPDSAAVGARLLSPDGAWVVFTADKELDNVQYLYSVPITGGEPVQLNPDWITESRIEKILISPDSQWVLYTADQEHDSVTELFRVPIDGSGPAVRLNHALYPSDPLKLVVDFEISGDSSQVIYIVEEDTTLKLNLFGVPLAGGSAIQHNLDTGSSGGVYSAHISPDSTRVVYKQAPGGGIPANLFSRLLSGGDRIPLTSIAEPLEGVTSFKISPDSKRVIYLAYQDSANARELFSITITGTLPARVNPAFPANRHVGSYEITPNSLGVVYIADQDTDNQNELYSAPIAGGGVTARLNGDLFDDGDVMDFKISPDSAKVVYRADVFTDYAYELWAAGIYGLNRIRLHSTLGAGEEVKEYTISPDSLKVVFRGMIDTEFYDLYAALIDGSAYIPLTDVENGTIYLRPNFRISPNSLGVAFIADLETLHEGNLYSISIIGTGLTKLNSPLGGAGRDVKSFEIVDNESVFYTADPFLDEKIELFRAFLTHPLYLPLATKP